MFMSFSQTAVQQYMTWPLGTLLKHSFVEASEAAAAYGADTPIGILAGSLIPFYLVLSFCTYDLFMLHAGGVQRTCIQEMPVISDCPASQDFPSGVGKRCMYARMHACTHARMQGCRHACMHVCMYACMYVCMSVRLYVCMSVCMYVCTYVCMYG